MTDIPGGPGHYCEPCMIPHWQNPLVYGPDAIEMARRRLIESSGRGGFDVGPIKTSSWHPVVVGATASGVVNLCYLTAKIVGKWDENGWSPAP